MMDHTVPASEAKRSYRERKVLRVLYDSGVTAAFPWHIPYGYLS